MTLDTNLNTPPYYDDFNANNNYHRILFRPSTAVQARELTQLQTILQDQVEKFGKHIFRDGSIIEGCTINLDARYDYVKILDNYANGTAFNIQDFIGKKAVGENGLEAYIVNSVQGYETETPDLNTLYVRYLNSTTYSNSAPQKVFDPDETLEIRTTANVLFGTTTAANSTSNTVGKGYAVSISEGTIFQKGFFISVYPQTLIVTKYTNQPNGVSVGFKTSETIVTADSDGTLFDNAIGSPNYNAPGANRLKLTANLVVRDTATSNTDNFFSIIDFEDGLPVMTRLTAQYATLGAEMAKRTFEESGNYIIDPFEMYVTSNTANTNSLVLEVDKGTGYVSGYRVELLNKKRTSIRKGTDVSYYDNQIVTANYGNYVYVQEVAGPLDVNNLDSIDLYDTANELVTKGTYISDPSPTGTKIGTANIRTLIYYSGVPGSPSAQYKLYLFNVKMDSGKNFKDVRTAYAADGSGRKFFADLVLESGEAILKELTGNQLVVDMGKRAVRDLRNELNTNGTQFTYRTQQDITFQSNGTATFSLVSPLNSAPETFAATGSLSETNESKFIVVTSATASSANVGGTANIVNGQANITGTSTTFATDFVVGDHVLIANATANAVHRIVSITNNTILTVANTANSTTAVLNGNVAIYYPDGGVISFARDDAANITVSANGTQAVLNLSKPLSVGTLSATVYYDVNRATANPATKTVSKTRFVKIQANTHSSNTVGPWSLGIPDVYRLRAVYQGTTFANTNTNQVANFILDTGQRDSHYDLASIAIRPGSGHSIGADDRLLVEFDHFVYNTTQGIGFFAVSSYQIDDANTANTTAITTQEIPIYRSPTSGQEFDLRDCIDFRPYVANTANSASAIADATTNPSANGTFVLANHPHTVTPDTNFITHFSYYLGRKDKVALSPQGKIVHIEGTPSIIPQAPKDADGTMTLGTLSIPPYPSLSQTDARLYDRQDYNTDITLTQNRRYTMRDIGVIDKKIDRLEYYTSLSLLEASAKTLLIKDSTGADRFKNGFLVEPFKGFDIADTKSPEFKAGIDLKIQEMAPTIQRTYVELDLDSAGSINIAQTNNIITLAKNTVPYITQSYASKFRNCVENIVFVWRGNITLTPEGDAEPDITIGPDVVTNIDLSGITDLVNSMPNIIGTERVVGTGTVRRQTTTNLGNITGDWRPERQRTVTTSSTTTTLRNDIDFSATTVDNTFNFGEVVQDISIQPFIRPKAVSFIATGMRPNTRVYPFFDNINVDAHCRDVSFQANTATVRTNFITTLAGLAWDAVSRRDRLVGGVSNTSVAVLNTKSGNGFVTSATGEVRGMFFIPADRFKTGDRTFTLADVEDLEVGADAITTRAAATYTASNINITKANVRLNTRLPQVTVNSIPVRNTITRTTSETSVESYDPIAQTFLINEPTTVAGVHIDKIDLYFQKKDANLGIEIQIREVDNGFPTTNIVPFGRKLLESHQCVVSADASLATSFVFDSPVFLESNKEYCFVVIPVGNSINWNIWVAEIGGTDITTQEPIFVNNFTGIMFTSSTNRVWTPFQREDIKFVIHRSQFTNTTGTIKYYNSNNEYLTAKNHKGTFTTGERVFVSNGIVTITSNASFTSTANSINLGNGVANAQTAFTVGSYIYVSANDGVITDVRTVSTLPNATHITVSSNLSFSDSNASIGYLHSNGTLFGYVNRNAPTANLLQLVQSSATGATNFVVVADAQANTAEANVIIIGEVSRARANLVSVDNVAYSTVVPQFSYVSPAGTTATISMKGYSTAIDSSFTQTTGDIETFFSDKERYVLSRSRELANNSGNRSLQVSVPISTDNTKVSPMFDDIKSNMVVYRNIISDSTTLAGESNSAGGNTQAKYISKRVVLAEGQDAEDLIVYLSAYKPSNTDIKVYCKLLNAEDGETIDQKSWSPMTQRTANSTVSSRVFRDDYKEFEYILPTYSNTTVSTEAFLNANNGNIVRYYGVANSVFDGYKSFAIKIVMVSDEGSHLVPRVSDMRAIALQA